MFIHNLDPVLLNFGFVAIRWYSLAYIAGILIGWVYCKKKLIKDQKILDLFDDFITYAILGIIVGGRIGYVLFYNFEYFFNNPIEILFVWNGGMSFHGGLIGVIIASNLFSKLNKVNTFIFLDLVSLSAPIGIFFGRIANFINSELYGTPTEVPWSVKFIAVDDINRHPSQLYEAFLEGIVLFFMLQFILKKNFAKKTGQISCLFLVLYSFFRIITEFFRTPDLHIGYLFFNLTLGQLISAVFLSIGLALYFYLKNEN